MAKKNLMAKLQKHAGRVTYEYDPFSHVIASQSPSVNFTFGNTWGLPRGYAVCLYGPQKAGKSLLCSSMIAQFHRDYPEGVALKFNTEFRERVQLTPAKLAAWGVDTDRYEAYETNIPSEIFDFIEKDVVEAIQGGVDVGLIIIDSITGVRGRRSLNATSVDVQQIGDAALTYQEGLVRILPLIRRYNIALILTAQVRAEMDALEQRRGNKFRMAVPYYIKHFAEYYMLVEENRNKDSREDILGQALEDADKKDVAGKAERKGHHIRVCMKDSSLGPKNRIGEFTIDYDAGIVNTHEEIYLLGVNRGIIERPNQLSYAYRDQKWSGKRAMVEAIRDDQELREAILRDIRGLDLQKVDAPIGDLALIDEE